MRGAFDVGTVISIDFGHHGPRVVALDAVSWWHVRQSMVEAAAFGATLGAIVLALAWAVAR